MNTSTPSNVDLDCEESRQEPIMSFVGVGPQILPLKTLSDIQIFQPSVCFGMLMRSEEAFLLTVTWYQMSLT